MRLEGFSRNSIEEKFTNLTGVKKPNKKLLIRFYKRIQGSEERFIPIFTDQEMIQIAKKSCVKTKTDDFFKLKSKGVGKKQLKEVADEFFAKLDLIIEPYIKKLA